MNIIVIISTLLCLAGIFSSFQTDELSRSIGRGKTLYQDFCMTCHLPNGLGTKSVIPPLANSDFLVKNRLASISSVKYGQKGTIVVNDITYNGLMPGPGLEDEEVVDVLNYVMHSWGNNAPVVTLKEVKNVKK